MLNISNSIDPLRSGVVQILQLKLNFYPINISWNLSKKISSKVVNINLIMLHFYFIIYINDLLAASLAVFRILISKRI